MTTSSDTCPHSSTASRPTYRSSGQAGANGASKIHRPITGKNLWRLCKTYGRIIGYPS